MDTTPFAIEAMGDGEYLVRAASHDESTSVVLVLSDATDVSDVELTDDPATASAAVRYLLEHQDASDLPARIEFGDLVAAYPEAVSRITALRES